MSPTFAVEITRLGLVCDLFAFFLAAPELLGEAGLRRLEDRMRVILWWVSVVIFAISMLLVIPFFFIGAIIILKAQASSGLIKLQTDWLLRLIIIGPIISAAISWIPKRIMLLLNNLSDDERARRLLLNVGIFLFVAGIIAQFVGTF